MNHSEFQQVLVIVAHPDDAELSAGGSIARWTGEGAAVRTVVCTNGDKGTKEDVSPFDLAKTREAEQHAASRILGVKENLFLRHRDGELEDTRAFKNQIAFLIRHFRPDTILTHDPWRPHYQHPDHQAIGHATFKAVIYARDHHFLPELGYRGHRRTPHEQPFIRQYAPPEFFCGRLAYFRSKNSRDMRTRVPDQESRANRKTHTRTAGERRASGGRGDGRILHHHADAPGLRGAREALDA